MVERYWVSEKVEDASPETIHKIEESIHKVEEVAQEKLHDLGERLHLTNAPHQDEKPTKAAPGKEVVKPERD